MNFFKIQYIPLLIGIIFIINSCGDNEGNENTGEPDNPLTYDGMEYQVNDAAIRDFGKIDLLELEDEPVYTHYDHDFLLTDGEISIGPGTFYDVADATFALEGGLASPDTLNFKAGTFSNFDFLSVESYDDVKGKYLFVCSLFLDKNENGDPFDDEDDEEIYVVSGHISASGQPQEFTIEFDVALENGKTIKGEVIREFKYQDLRD